MPILARVRRFIVWLFSFVLTLAVMGGAGTAVFYGQDWLQARAAAQPAPEPAPLVSVSVRPLTQEPSYSQTRYFVGQIEPQKTVAASFELAGQLQRIEVDEGDQVSAGQLLATQDVELLEAERTALLSSREGTQAQLDFNMQQVERAEALLDRGFASQERLDAAIATKDELTARIREIDANLASVEIRLTKAELRAPFAGRITQRFVDGGEALSPGQAVLEVIETTAPLVRVGVPLKLDATTLRRTQVIVDGQAYAAKLVTLRPDIDPVTRTRTALFSLENAPAFAFGRTAEVAVETVVEMPGTWVPIDSLKEGTRGQWTLLVLNERDVVERATALILHAESDRVYVQGSFPDGTRMIESGTQRVVPGQSVAPKLLSEG